MTRVHNLRHRNGVRITAALVALFSWFVASNHCALGLMAKPVAPMATHDHCSGHATPAKGKTNDSPSACCQSLLAPAFAPAKTLVAVDLNWQAIQPFLVALDSDAAFHASMLTPREIDPGPPVADSFAESVLQRSLLAHAPPIS